MDGLTMSRGSTRSAMKDMEDELHSLRCDCKLKDDTIKFLQKEKEKLTKEVQHYEKLCANVENDVFVSTHSAEENARLREELNKMKETIRRQRAHVKLLSSNDGYDDSCEDSGASEARALGASVCNRLALLLRDGPGIASRLLQSRLADEAHRYEHLSPARPELCLELVALADSALGELCEQRRRRGRHGIAELLPTVYGTARPVLRYAYAGNAAGTETPYGQLSSETLILARRQRSATVAGLSRSDAGLHLTAGGMQRATTAAAGQSPTFIGIDSSTVLPGLKPVSVLRR